MARGKKGDSAAQRPINPAALSVYDLAKVLSVAGKCRIAVAQIEEDIAAGAPVSADGTLNLVHYVAWLNRQVDDDGD